jgi:hypothetical protein
MLTPAELLDILIYYPEEGIFRWRKSVGPRKAGDIAGSRLRPGIRRKECWQMHVKGKCYRRSRLAWFWMNGTWPPHEVDHIDLNALNDRWNNLRSATREQNEANKTKYKNNTTGFKGVYWTRKRFEERRYKSSIWRNGKRRHLGCFDTPEEAHFAYMAASRELDGEFSRVL